MTMLEQAIVLILGSILAFIFSAVILGPHDSVSNREQQPQHAIIVGRREP